MIYDKSKYTKKEFIDFVVKNQSSIIAQKKTNLKKCDAFVYGVQSKTEATNKEFRIDKQPEEGQILVKTVINTTNVMDSHDDVHIPGIWNKTLKENRNLLHLQEHELKFDKIISDGDDLLAYTEDTTFKEIGIDLEGTTQALVFESIVKESRNKYMYNQYKNGYVKEHSVGMYYVKILTCVNDSQYPTEYENWNKYITQVANKEQAEAQGVFFAVLEAKAMEGSAVPKGSNFATPTIETVQHNNNTSLEDEAAKEALRKQADIEKKRQFYLSQLN